MILFLSISINCKREVSQFTSYFIFQQKNKVFSYPAFVVMLEILIIVIILHICKSKFFLTVTHTSLPDSEVLMASERRGGTDLEALFIQYCYADFSVLSLCIIFQAFCSLLFENK